MLIRLIERFKEPQMAILGLTFKPDIDDLRESPALMILKRLSQRHNTGGLYAAEPNINSLPEDISNVEFCSYDQAISCADIVVVLVKHKQFAMIDKGILKDKIVLDFVNAF